MTKIETDHRRDTDHYDEMAHLMALSGNPLSEETMAMFDMFDREGYDFGQREAYILNLCRQSSNEAEQAAE